MHVLWMQWICRRVLVVYRKSGLYAFHHVLSEGKIFAEDLGIPPALGERNSLQFFRPEYVLCSWKTVVCLRMLTHFFSCLSLSTSQWPESSQKEVQFHLNYHLFIFLQPLKIHFHVDLDKKTQWSPICTPVSKAIRFIFDNLTPKCAITVIQRGLVKWFQSHSEKGLSQEAVIQ